MIQRTQGFCQMFRGIATGITGWKFLDGKMVVFGPVLPRFGDLVGFKSSFPPVHTNHPSINHGGCRG